MSFQLDEATLAIMTQEARQCFLDEDAPEYLHILEQAIKPEQKGIDFTDLLRAIHSLKGGAGAAQIHSLGDLTHRLEDLLEVLQIGQTSNAEEGKMLLVWGISEVAMLLQQARTVQEVEADPDLLKALADFMLIQPQPTAQNELQGLIGESSLIKTALMEDLEDCCTRIKQVSPQTPIEEIEEYVVNFYDECLLLGETLNLHWLLEIIEPLEQVLQKADPFYALETAQKISLQIRAKRNQYLKSLSVSNAVNLIPDIAIIPHLEKPKKTVSDLLNNKVNLSEDILTNQTKNAHENKLVNQEIVPSEDPILLVEKEQTTLSQVRIPLEKLETMTNNIEELLVAREQLRLQQQQLSQVTRKLRQIARQLQPIQEQVQTAYHQLAIVPLSTPSTSAQTFDSLELDRFSELHSDLQTFQELMLQVQENYADLNLINQDFSGNLETVTTNLDSLYTNINESRLVPFKIMAKRFIPQIKSLNRRYGKSVNFVISGEDVLIDQVLLEQLQNPLTHLVNNAFDHGIEYPSERLANNKSETAQILLKAEVQNNQLVISLTDDGQGIDLQKIYLKAKEKGLIASKMRFDQLSEESILDLIFQPNFSTSDTINELSGRGVGLDIVRTKIQRLRGTIQVKSQAEQGAIFTLKFPLNLSLLSLFLVQWQNHILAFPTASVLETLPVSELNWIEGDISLVQWRGQAISVIPLSELLGYPSTQNQSISPKVGLVLETSSIPVMVMVDTLMNEQQLIVKPFDDTVNTPTYLAGCTILGSGDIVPVILPQAFTLSSQLKTPLETPITCSVPIKTHPTILIAEDSVATRHLLERVLTQVGFMVIACRDGQEAVDQLNLHSGAVDLIISDIEMPQMNGFELLETLRAHKNWAKIPVIMATSRTGQRHQEQASQLGAKGYLGKPILPKVLLETIEPFLKTSS